MWIPVWVNVEKEAEKEVNGDWKPSPDVVAKFISGEVVNIETDENWVITQVFSKPESR